MEAVLGGIAGEVRPVTLEVSQNPPNPLEDKAIGRFCRFSTADSFLIVKQFVEQIKLDQEERGPSLKRDFSSPSMRRPIPVKSWFVFFL
jgi:hypothetical protein